MRRKLARHVNRLEVLLLLAALIVTAGMLAVPGLASAADTTTLTASALNSTVTWGGHTIVTGTLMDTTTHTAVGGQWVRVEWSLTPAPISWNLLDTVTTDSSQYLSLIHIS